MFCKNARLPILCINLLFKLKKLPLNTPKNAFSNYNSVITPFTLNTNLNIRNYSKSKDRGKSKKGTKKVDINLDQLKDVIDVSQYETQMKKSITILKDEYIKNLSLRSTTGKFAIRFDSTLINGTTNCSSIQNYKPSQDESMIYSLL